MQIFLETERLLTRQLEEADLPALQAILQDDETMRAYEGAFSDAEVESWLLRQQERYRDNGLGLYAVLLKETGQLIGQCGLTCQQIPGEQVIEVGYLFHRAHWHRGYATEAAGAFLQYAFEVRQDKAVYAIIRDSNLASQRVAKRLHMRPFSRFTKHYRGVDMPHTVYKIDRDITT